MNTVEKRTIDLSVIAGSKLKEQIEVPPELQILEGNEPPSPYHYVFRILHPEKGDERLTWDSRSFAELRAAKTLFIELIKKGLKPFRVGTDGRPTSDVMAEFDPHAEEVIFLPYNLIAGG